MRNIPTVLLSEDADWLLNNEIFISHIIRNVVSTLKKESFTLPGFDVSTSASLLTAVCLCVRIVLDRENGLVESLNSPVIHFI